MHEQDPLVTYLPIIILLAVVAIVVRSLPKIDLGHSPAFTRRRFWNWFPLGLTYALLYMGRYNLTVSKNFLPAGVMTKEDFATIFFWDTLTYGISFLINGPLADRIGARATILLPAAGSAIMNAAMGLVVVWGVRTNLVLIFSVLYAMNMYFQSFGAVSIVKVNASWFHLKERGAFGGIFGILISLGIFLAYDVGRKIAESAPVEWVFFVPCVLLVVFFIIAVITVRDTPAEAGLADFDTGDASSGDTGPRLPVTVVFMKMFKNPIIMTIAGIELCSGFLRNAIMQWYPIFAKETGIHDGFVAKNWGMLLCCAGIFGGMFAGQISDRLFHSRRPPVAAVLYGTMLVGALFMYSLLTTPALGWAVIFMSLGIIGVHGILSGTASMDFGGKKNVGVAVGIIDGFVYLGTALQAIVVGKLLPEGKSAALASNWGAWPLVMVPAGALGFYLSTRVWNAIPKKNAVVPLPSTTTDKSNGAGSDGASVAVSE